MMKRRGFTLIELLAVIVILAIIALIATPIVMNVIEKSKKGAAERSAENYIDAVETKVATERLDNKIIEGTYTIDDNGNLTGNGLTEPLIIEMSGTKPTDGSVTIENGQVVPTGTTMKVGDYNVSYNNEKKTYVATKVNEENSNVLCTAVTSKVNALVWAGNDDPGNESSYTQQEVGLIASESGAYTPGVAYTCELGDGEEETFYVLEENGDNVTLLLGRNLGSMVAWSSDGSNHKDDDESAQAVTAKAALRERTAGWTKLTEDQISMPTYDQIYKAAGNKTSGFATWLNSYTKFTDGAYYGYWTSTPDASYSYSAWSVLSYGNLSNILVDGDSYGVRPVITISKTELG